MQAPAPVGSLVGDWACLFPHIVNLARSQGQNRQSASPFDSSPIRRGRPSSAGTHIGRKVRTLVLERGLILRVARLGRASVKKPWADALGIALLLDSIKGDTPSAGEPQRVDIVGEKREPRRCSGLQRSMTGLVAPTTGPVLFSGERVIAPEMAECYVLQVIVGAPCWCKGRGRGRRLTRSARSRHTRPPAGSGARP